MCSILGGNLEDHIKSSWPQESWQDDRIVVAVSGGADSVGLARALAAIVPTQPHRLIIAHFNHRWRGQESDDDARFVNELARKLQLDCELGTATVDPQHDAVAIRPTEEAARRQRYAFLERVAEQRGARYVVTAHTADDQAETVLHRILRGTGIGGLAGIPRVRVLSPAVSLIRPLLAVRRLDILDYLSAIQQDFREDSSNRDVRFTRNRIRQELIPSLEADYNPHVTAALTRLSQLAREHQQFLAEYVLAEYDRCILAETDSHVVIDIGPLAQSRPIIVREFFLSLWKRKQWPRQAMGQPEWQALQTVITRSQQPTFILPGNISCRRENGTLVVRRHSYS